MYCRINATVIKRRETYVLLSSGVISDNAVQFEGGSRLMKMNVEKKYCGVRA